MNEEERDAYLIRIISGIAHEIRNPLQGIIASLAAVSWRLDNDPSAQPFLQMIQSEVGRINGIIDDMLIIRQPVVMDQVPHDLGKILEDAVRCIKEEADRNKSRVEFINENGKMSLTADGHGLSRAIQAIIKNAIESREESPSVQIRCNRPDPSLCVVSVSDDGTGISAENMHRVFEPFFTTKHKRIGLGLYVADRVVRAHGGSIRVQSESGKGTEVQVHLPLHS